MDKKKKIEIEAEVFQKLVKHFRKRTDVQNIDLMNTADFCRNCLSKWYMASAKKKGIKLIKFESIWWNPSNSNNSQNLCKTYEYDKKFLQKSINSVSRQTYKNYEHIIIDGKSTDGTVDILKKNKIELKFELFFKNSLIVKRKLKLK